MDETTDPHMETDVSSTTEDVPEMQEVTGSNGNVVLIVEKLEEGNVEPSPKSKEKPLQVNENTSPGKLQKPQQSPTKDAVSPKVKLPNKPPILQKIVLKRPPNPISSLDQLNKSPSLDKQVQQSNNAMPQSIEPKYTEGTVDSSNKVGVQKSPNKREVEIINKSPHKDVDVEITIRKIPTILQGSQKSSETSPTKETSPSKANIQVTPKVTQVSNQKLPVKGPVIVQKSPVKTPPKEQSESKKSPQKSPVKDLQEIQKSSIKTPTKELPSEPTKTPPNEAAAQDKVNGDVEEKNDKPSNINDCVPEEIIEKDASNDSQIESLDSEKDHNKSISRELKSLINSAKESKIISECTQLTSKTRKSRTALDSSNPLNTSMEADKIQGNRRHSSNSQKSNCSEKSDKTAVKRSMRSQNPEFVNKVKLFLNSVTKVQKDSDEGTDEEIEDVKVKDPPPETREYCAPKKKKLLEADSQEKTNKLRSDPYCWRCHWAIEQPANDKTHPPMNCTVCPRTFHFKCLSGAERSKINLEKNWVCPECMAVLHAESSETRSPAMKKISLGMLCELLKFALQRMMDLNGVEPFMQPVDRTMFPDYDKYVVHPMDLSLMKDNITAGLYGSTEAFVADAQWILHNSIIFNTLQSKLTAAARALVRSCRAEMGEIEACPECYKAAHARRPTWFTDVCSTPHVLLWAKLKGFPYWPAKAMTVNNAGLVDVRFFGAHDRAWVPAKDCFLYSERDPNNFRTKRQDILDSMQEAEQHIRNISRKYGKFVYPPFKTQFDPTKLTEQIKLMIPSFEGEVRSAVKDKSHNSSPNMSSTKSRSNSKSSKEGHDGDISDGEESSTVTTRKMASGAEIAREEEDSVDKDKTMDVDVSQTQTPAKEESSRKRRRSEMEEAVITIMETSVSKEKKKKVDEKVKAEDKTDVEKKDVEMKPVETEKTEKPQEKSESTPKNKEKQSTPIQVTAEKQKTPRVAPIKIVTTPKGIKTAIRSSTPKIKLVAKKAAHVHKRSASEKRSSKDEKKQKRRHSRNKSLNCSSTIPKDKSEKKSNESTTKDKEGENKSKQNSESSRIKDRIQFDDDTSLAVLARKSKDSENDVTGLPTISSVMSLSTTAQNTHTTTSQPTTTNKSIEVTIEANSSSSIFTPTSTDNVKNMKEAVTKLQKLRSDTDNQSLVGKVGVRAFARMTSPPKNAPNTNNKDVEVEIKAEPIDLDDSDRHMEKMDLMNAFHLRPVNPPTSSNLREVRINKLVVRPLPTPKRGKVLEVKPRAKKTFPQPRRPEEGRSELNGKNSMVYIPIQPATTPGPLRAARPPVSAPALVSTPTATTVIRPPAPIVTTSANNIVNTTPTLVPAASTSSPMPVVSATSPIQTGPTVGQATVHTVPLITSVNGQWTLSLQPMMSVGSIDGTNSPPLVNGSPERVPNVTSFTHINNVAGIANVNQVGGLPTVNSMTGVTNMAGIANMANTGVTAAVVPITAAVVAPPTAPRAANRLNDTPATPGEPPRLQQRPPLLNPLDARTPIGNVPPPSTVGPLTAKLNQNAVKLTDFFRTLLEDCLDQFSLDEPTAQVTTLKLQLEQLRWRHQQEIDELNHNHELTIAEMRSSFEKERLRVVSEVRRAAQLELENAVKLAKAKQWCANCSQEAQFYCCWNTSYCDYPCQRAHWAHHFAVCTQKRAQDGSGGENSNTSPPERLQPQPENLPALQKSAPMLAAAGGKQTRGPQQDSIIMTVTEDASGNQTLKCVGTYKPPAGSAPAQISPVVINKQVISNEDNPNKKVVTSGGYLIVGAGVSNASSIVTQPRRSHTIQYFT